MQSFELFLFSFYIICIEPHPSVSEYCNPQLLVGIVGTKCSFRLLEAARKSVPGGGLRCETGGDGLREKAFKCKSLYW